MINFLRRLFCIHKYEYECTAQECRKCGHIREI